MGDFALKIQKEQTENLVLGTSSLVKIL